MRPLLRIAGSTLLYLVMFDLIGVGACLVFDVAGVLPLQIGATSTALYYTLWMVLGIFCGLLSYDRGGRTGSGAGPGEWTNREGAGRVGVLVVSIECVMMAAVSILCYLFLWRDNMAPSSFVPDNVRLTVAFFVAILAAVVFAHAWLRPNLRK